MMTTSNIGSEKRWSGSSSDKKTKKTKNRHGPPTYLGPGEVTEIGRKSVLRSE